MAFIVNEDFFEKAKALKRPLRVKRVSPKRIVEFVENNACFQNLEVIDKGEFLLPVVLNSGDKILIDFGEHFVGYLNYSIDNYGGKRICDSPVRFKFSFGEFPFEITKPIEKYTGGLGNGWFQREEKFMPFMPYKTKLERRYAFRYLLIERTDNADFPIVLNDIFADTVSAVDINDVLPLEIKDEQLKRIYWASVRTLKECEQDVFEDGPKRDRRLWLGDLRVQALTDYKTFKNYRLIKRCLYLLASHRTESRYISSCFFADSPPYIDDQPGWILTDYCLFFISCLYDYYEDCRDLELLKEFYQLAEEQIMLVHNAYKGWVHPFIDWCPGLDKQVAFLGVYLYVLKQFKYITALLEKSTEWIDEEINIVSKLLFTYYDSKRKLFVTSSGQISQHSQIWAVLSGVLPSEEAICLANKIDEIDTEYTMRTPFAVHYYIEALYSVGLKSKAIDKIKNYWGNILDCGYDCCPECFNENDDFESPYKCPELNSACHAWSCTAAYWIHRFISEA